MHCIAGGGGGGGGVASSLPFTGPPFASSILIGVCLGVIPMQEVYARESTSGSVC